MLLERQVLCNGTTGRSGAIVRQHYSNDFIVRIAKDSLVVFQHFADPVGGDCVWSKLSSLMPLRFGCRSTQQRHAR